MRSALVVLLLLTVAANAQVPAKIIPVPFSMHRCTEDYPAEAIAAHSEGTATLGFVITTEGSIRDVAVTKSSGSKVLDVASVRCAATWHYFPVVVEGKKIELPWRAEVRWIIPPSLVFAELPRNCIDYYQVPAKQLPRAKPTELRITVHDGQVIEIFLSTTSGYGTLDDQAIACVKTWQFLPVTEDGNPIDVVKDVVIPWQEARAPRKCDKAQPLTCFEITRPRPRPTQGWH